MPAPSTQALLAVVHELAALSSAHEILVAACRGIAAWTGARSVHGSSVMPGQAWERGHHVSARGAEVGCASAPGRSAMFAIQRRLAAQSGPLELHHDDDTQAVFRALSDDAPTRSLHAIPLVHRTGRLCGQFVVVGADAALDPVSLEIVVRHATLALENAQRLAFARRDQERLLLLAEATDDALYDHDHDTKEFWWGGGILKLFGADVEPVENTPRWKAERVHSDDRDRVRAAYEAALGDRVMSWNAEYRFVRSDGSHLVVEDRCYFLRDGSGRVCRTIGSLRDVTALKLLLAREQEARNEAERASRAKDEFLAMLGHELRNPLAPIVTGLELLKLRGSHDLARSLPVLERQAQHLIRLVDDLLDVSRVAHGKIELRKERLELSTVLATVIEAASPLLETRQHTLEVDVPARGLVVDADRARLTQALGNLLSNAAKYTEPGGQVRIRGYRDGDAIVVSVRDTGIGIEPAMLPHVFNMFVQERQAIDRAHGGLGLGLSIVRGLVELHGGSVVARSQGRGHGSEFVVRLPATLALVPGEPPPAPVTRPRAVSGHNILIVDDNEDAALILASLLDHLGHATRVAHTARDALSVVDGFAPDLAVLDIGLPDLDGYELASELRRRCGIGPLHMVALTGYGQASDRERATQAGFAAHLVKPVAFDALKQIITSLLPRERAPAIG